MNSWKSFLTDITVQNVWKKIYAYGVKPNFTKRLEISGIEVSSGNFTSSFEGTIDAVLRKSFPCDPSSHDNFQHRFLRFEAELVSFLQCRSADLTLGNVTKNRVLEKGCPQGSVMGPFLWNLIVNDLLCTISKFQNCPKIAFEDDVLLIVQCKHFQDVCTLSQQILNNILDWSELYKLEFNPLKPKNSLRRGGTLNFLICTDSLSSLHCLLSVNSTEKLVVDVQSILYYLDCDIHFSYVRDRSGNLGNDRADQLAKETTSQDMNLLISVPLSHWKHVAWEITVSSWNNEFLASPKALWTERFFPTIYQRGLNVFTPAYCPAHHRATYASTQDYALCLMNLSSNGSLRIATNAPNDYHLFHSLDYHLRGKSFTNEADVRQAHTDFSASHIPEFYRKGIEQLETRWQKVLDADVADWQSGSALRFRGTSPNFKLLAEQGRLSLSSLQWGGKTPGISRQTETDHVSGGQCPRS
ncbi:RNase H domain-containing protein [Trichonephila clavipes]|nr:RNase H domain-containing protein [Trichonephila clavipes]